MSARWLVRCVASAGMLLASCVTAILAHGILETVQLAGLLAGDYGSYSHGSVAPVVLGALTTAAAAAFLYAVHLAGSHERSLPSLARRLQSRIGWKTVAVTALTASTLLVGMETTEQLAAGHFDGIASAFGGVPIVGLLAIAVFSTAINAVLRACCRWLCAAHARIVLAIAYLVRSVRDSRQPAFSHARLPLAAVGCYDCGASRVYGRRGPPLAR